MAGLNGALERIADAGSAIGSMVDNIRSMSRDTERIKAHSAHLDSIDERLDQIVAQMERLVSAVEDLRNGEGAAGFRRAGWAARRPLPGQG